MSRIFKSNNPMLSDKAIAKAKAKTLESTRTIKPIERSSEFMSVSGAVNKTMLLVGIMLISGFYSYLNPVSLFMPLGVFGGLAVYMFTNFKPHWAPTTAPMYALLQGLFVGTVSANYAAELDGIILQAVSLTIATLISMLLIFRSGLIQVTDKFRMGVSMAVGAIMLVYLIRWIGAFTGFEIPYLHEGGTIGIGITVVIIGVAALNLLLDFDNFDQGERSQLAKHYEWLFGMGLLFTLIWLYVEFLRLISKFQSD